MSLQLLLMRSVDTVELVECLDFLNDWLDYDYRRLEDSLFTLTQGGYQIRELRDDLTRFARLLERAQVTFEDRP